MMEYLTLNNGVQMPLAGFGTFMLGGETCKNAVAWAIKNRLYRSAAVALAVCQLLCGVACSGKAVCRGNDPGNRCFQL